MTTTVNLRDSLSLSLSLCESLSLNIVLSLSLCEFLSKLVRENSTSHLDGMLHTMLCSSGD